MSENCFDCSYCEKEFDSQSELADHIAKHFRDTDRIPVKTKNRNSGTHVIDNWDTEKQELYEIPGIEPDMTREEKARVLEKRILDLEADIHG